MRALRGESGVSFRVWTDRQSRSAQNADTTRNRLATYHYRSNDGYFSARMLESSDGYRMAPSCSQHITVFSHFLSFRRIAKCSELIADCYKREILTIYFILFYFSFIHFHF